MPKKKRTIQQLESELRAKQRRLDVLLAGRDRLAARLAEIDREIADLTGKTARARRKAPGKTRRKVAKGAKKTTRARKRAAGKPLAEYLRNVLKTAKNPVRVRDAMRAVLEAGYPTRSKDFYGLVAATLRDNAEFVRTGRGLYTLK